MNWKTLSEEKQLDTIIEDSAKKPVVIYKHSTTCPVNSDAKKRLEAASQPEGVDFYYLDLLNLRPLSNEIAERFNVRHQSPQVLVIKDGQCVYHQSHNKIEMEDIVAHTK